MLACLPDAGGDAALAVERPVVGTVKLHRPGGCLSPRAGKHGLGLE